MRLAPDKGFLFLKILFYFIFIMYMGGGCVYIRVHMPWSPEEGNRYPGPGVTGGGEPPDMGDIYYN